MATSNAASPDTLIAIKLQVGTENRRFKLPLRELGASTLPDKVSLAPLVIRSMTRLVTSIHTTMNYIVQYDRLTLWVASNPSGPASFQDCDL
jgi:hypothetical protein